MPYKAILFLLALFTLQSEKAYPDPIRIASYNAKYFSACINDARKEALDRTFQGLKADIDLIYENSSLFPGCRDLLRIYITIPELEQDIKLLNHHAKSRYGGRVRTEPRRVDAASKITSYLKNRSTDKPAIILGDFNENPDDASLNTLEEGQVTSWDTKNEKGKFLVNLAEPLLDSDIVSYGLNSWDVEDGTLDPIRKGNRNDNYKNYDNDYEVTKALYDQILVSHPLAKISNLSSMSVINSGTAAKGNRDIRA